MSDTTGFDVNEKVNVLFKTAMGFPSTKESTNWFQETNVPYNTYVFGSDILTDDIPTNPTYGAAKTSASVGLTDNDFDTGGFVKDSNDGKVRYYHRLILDPCITNNNDSWHKENSSGVNVLMNALQFNVNKTASNTPYGYVLTNKANVAADNAAPNEILQNAAGGNWFFDIKSGIVFFPDNSTPSLGVVDNSTKKPVFSFYKYIGNKGLSTWSGGGGGGSTTLGGLTDVSTTGATDGQALVWDNATSKWKPGSVAAASSGSGSSGLIHFQGSSNTKYSAASNGFLKGLDGYWSDPRGTPYTVSNVDIFKTYGSIGVTHDGAMSFQFKNEGEAMDNNTGIFLCPQDGVYICSASWSQNIASNATGHVIMLWQLPEFVSTYDTQHWCHDRIYLEDGETCADGVSKNIWFPKNTKLAFGTLTTRAYDFLRVSISLMGTGAGGTTTGSSDAVKDGQVLETLEGLCDGRTVIGASGTYTLPNVTATQDLTETYTDLTGSLINYKPPSGTKIVVYSLKVQASVGGGTYWNCGYQLYIDDVAFGVINLKGTAAYNSQEEVIEIRIYITGTDDYANYNIASWESLKTIKLKCRERNSSRQSKMHHSDGYVTEVGGPGGLAKPTMKIQAIGRGTSGVPLAGTNLVHKRITNSFSYLNIAQVVTPANTVASATELTEFEIKINPEYSDSVIHAEWNIWHEGYENMVFRIVRFVNGVSTVFSNDDTTAESGYAVVKYNVDNDSTPSQLMMDLYDEPNTTTEVTYKIYISNIYATNSHIVFNRAYNDAGFAASAPSSTGEKLVSTVKATEHPKPNKALNSITSATQVDGQVLETFAGICDGRSITSASGTYTLENVTAIQEGTTTWTDVIGSKINYTPPAGTRQVVYEFFVHRRWGSANSRAIFHYALDVDGSILNIARHSRGGGTYDEAWESVMFTFEIGTEDDPTNGKYLSWNTAKAIKVQSRDYTVHYGHRLHESLYWNGSEPAGLIVKPHLKITAIGTADYDVVQRVVTYKDGQVLEKLIGNCDGRTVTVSSGTYTIQDARGSSTYSGTQWAGQTTTTTWATMKGSEISYKPPPGTNKVLFKFNLNVRYLDEDCIIYTRLIIDGSDRIFFKEISTREYPSLQVQLAYVIDIGTVEEINDHSAKFLNWDSLKTLKIEVRSHTTTYDAILFVSQWDNDQSADHDVFQFPILEITAIGRQVAPASAADFKIQKVDTISTLPNNGNMLTWDQAKGRWKPSEFIVSNDDGTKNISDVDFNYNQGYQITSSSYLNFYIPENAFRGNSGYGPSVVHASWHTASGKYNTTTGVQTSNVDTSGYKGEWIQINFGKKAKVYHFGIRGTERNDVNHNNKSPGKYKLFGSNDGSNWTDVHTGSAVASDYGTNFQLQNRETLSTPATYQYFRLVVNEILGGGSNGGHLALEYLAFYGNFPNERIQTLPVSGTNMVHVSDSTYFSTTITAKTIKNYEYQAMRLVITPTAIDSVIEIKYTIFAEMDHNNNFRITRNINGTDVLVVPTTEWDEGIIAVSTYDEDYTTTPQTINFTHYDEPNTTSTVTYKVWVGSTHTSNKTIYFNGGNSSTGGDFHELGVSKGAAIEHPKPNTAVLSSVNNSTAVEGQVLETLSGMCDGRSISVASGNYTLQDVTSTILVTGSNTTAGQPNDPWIDLTGSTINYTPPVGTKQVIYEFDYAHSSTDTNYSGAMHNHRILLDGVKIEQSQRCHRTGGTSMYEVAHERVMCIIDIVEEDDITNNKVKSWRTSKEIKIQVASYSSNYKALMHSIQHSRSQYYGLAPENGGTHDDDVGHLRKPNIKITAVGTAQYDVVQRVATYKDGQVLETLSGLCDGRSITSASGTYTLPNISSVLDMTGSATYQDIPGSFAYKPPQGTTQVIYKYKVYCAGKDNHPILHFNLYIDDTKVDKFDRSWAAQGGGEHVAMLDFTFEIGKVNDIANGKLLTWDTLKTIKIKAREYTDSSHEVYIFGTGYYEGTWTSIFVCPSLEITAIGRSVEPASAADFKIQRVNTLSSEPDNGSVLLYDSGKKEWTASGTRMEDQNIRLLSNPNVYPDYEMLASSTYNDSDEWYQAEAAFHLNHTYGHAMWSSANSKYASSGTPRSYSGSETTEGYSGEWVQINLKKKAKIYYYGVSVPKSHSVLRQPYDWRIYGSNNGTNWTQLDEQQGRDWESWWTNWNEKPSSLTSKGIYSIPQKVQYVELSQPVTYQYFRMVINKIENSDTKVQLGFLGFYGVWDTISATTSVQAGTNMVTTTYTTATSITAPNSVPGVNIPELNLTITPQYSDSVIELKFNVFHETNNDNVFRITRNINGADVLVVPATNIWEGGIDVPKYDTQTNSTPEVTKVRWYDEPNTTSPVTYKLWINSSSTGGAQTVYLNRAYSNAGASLYENGVSTSAAIEHPKPQAILSTVSNSTALEGQVLETLTGICDGRSVTVASGTYTLPNVTAAQTTTTSYVDITGSSIENYKPPPGTKQVIYDFSFQVNPDHGSSTDRFNARYLNFIKMLIYHDGAWVAVTNQIYNVSDNDYNYGENYTFRGVIDITGTNDIPNGKLSSWDSPKSIILQIGASQDSYRCRLHSIRYGGGPGTTAITNIAPIRPKIKIQAIGTTYHSAVPRIVTKKSGQLLETIAGICDGRSITSASGTYTLENVTQGTLLAASSANFIDFPGSSINYKPPSGVKQVFYTFQFASGRKDADSSLGFKFFIDGVEATIFKKYYGTNGDYGSSLHTIHFVIDIGSVATDDIANGKLATWNTLKTIKLEVAGQNTGYETWINKQYYDMQQGQSDSNADTSHNASTYVNKPVLKIQAFGEAGTAACGVITETGGRVGIGVGALGVMYSYKKLVVYQTGTNHGIYSEGSATQTHHAYTARNSSGTDTWAIRYNGTTAVSSDDRLKHNEIELTNVLDIIDRLKPVRYFKTGKMFEENHNFEIDSSGNPITTDDYHIETGLIAQQVNTIPELQYCVGGGSNEISGDQPYNVNYNDIFVYNIAATKELHKKVISLETKNTELENRVKELENIIKETENKVNDAEMKVNTVYHKNGLLEAEIMMIKNKLGM